MIVIAIMALVVAVGVPAMFRVFQKDSLRQVVIDIVEACNQARAQAILDGTEKALVLNMQERTISAPGHEAVHIPDRVMVELVGVNFVDVKDMPSVNVRFFPNSTSDEFTIVLRSDQNEIRKISLEVVTALADVESNPAKFTH